jgi:hypothetical protein
MDICVCFFCVCVDLCKNGFVKGRFLIKIRETFLISTTLRHFSWRFVDPFFSCFSRREGRNDSNRCFSGLPKNIKGYLIKILNRMAFHKYACTIYVGLYKVKSYFLGSWAQWVCLSWPARASCAVWNVRETDQLTRKRKVSREEITGDTPIKRIGGEFVTRSIFISVQCSAISRRNWSIAL